MRPFLLVSLCAFACLAVGCAKTTLADLNEVGGSADPDAFRQFKAYVGQDLSHLYEQENQRRELLGAIAKLVPGRQYNKHDDYDPRYIWEFARGVDDHSSYLLLEVDYLGSVQPGSSPLRLTLFGNMGELISEHKFDTGYRCYLAEACLQDAGHDGPLLVLETEEVGLGPDWVKQYYARIGERFDLIRLEDHNGAVCRNSYYDVRMAGPLPRGAECGLMANRPRSRKPATRASSPDIPWRQSLGAPGRRRAAAGQRSYGADRRGATTRARPKSVRTAGGTLPEQGPVGQSGGNPGAAAGRLSLRRHTSPIRGGEPAA